MDQPSTQQGNRYLVYEHGYCIIFGYLVCNNISKLLGGERVGWNNAQLEGDSTEMCKTRQGVSLCEKA